MAMLVSSLVGGLIRQRMWRSVRDHPRMSTRMKLHGSKGARMCLQRGRCGPLRVCGSSRLRMHYQAPWSGCATLRPVECPRSLRANGCAGLSTHLRVGTAGGGSNGCTN